MCRKSVYLISFVLVLSIAGNASADLVSYWTFDEGSGDAVYDTSGNDNNGTINGATWGVGKYGTALQFNGQDNYVEVPSSNSLEIEENVTIAAWVNWIDAGDTWICILANGQQNGPWENYGLFVNRSSRFLYFTLSLDGGHVPQQTPNNITVPNEWVHVCATWDGSAARIYVNAEMELEIAQAGTLVPPGLPLRIGHRNGSAHYFNGTLDEVRIYNHALTEAEILAAMEGGKGYPYALGPSPEDGALYADTWATISWRPGDYAVSHDVYIGENFDDVNDGTGDTYQGNQSLTYFVAGFPGYPYPDGLVPGTTYYWRIDEVNEAEPNSPWKGNVWSFSIPPKTAYYPEPANGAEFIDLNVQLNWTAGFGTKLHYIVFGEDFDEVSNAAMGVPNGTPNYNPGPLNLAKTYYWRVDEFDGTDTYKGEVWSFTTLGAVSGPNPADGTVDVKPSVVLSWDAGAVAASHEVYFGADADAVANATTTSPEYKGSKVLGEESYDPGKLMLNTAYYWRIDEVNAVSPDSPWAGNVWSFTTGDFFVIDDFEDYDADNPIWYSWNDGLGYGSPGVAPYFAGNGSGSGVGDETTASTCEETIVHGGNQSMPFGYDNNKTGYSKYSEAGLTLMKQRDWTEQGVAELSLCFRGYPGSVGSFVEGPAGTYTMTASGADIWAVNGVEADEFHFAYKMLTGVGSMVAKVESIDNTNVWAKAGVMIRETLNPDSAHTMMVVTPGSGVSFQRRPGTGQTSTNTDTGSITAPYWVKIERDLSGNFTAYHSANGSAWTMQGTENIPMSSNVYIGLAVTAHDAALTCEAVFSNVTTTGTVGPQWANQDIGIASNDAEPLYVAISNSAGAPVVVVHDDPTAAQIDTWTEWVIPMQTLADQGITLTNVDRIAIGLGTQGNMAIPGGSGKMFFDDIRLYRPRDAAE
ncbi:MAG: LamG domain-containing protein [Sedimentisphaerales bacterium]